MGIRAGSFVPNQPHACLYAMAGDDCSLHFDLANLTPGQQEDHLANQVLTGMLLTALGGIGRADDHLALYNEHLEPSWRDTLTRYRGLHRRMGLDGVADANLSGHPVDGYYHSVASSLPEVARVNLYMVSGSNAVLHNDPEALSVSRNVNSKVHFAHNAPQAGLPVPETWVTTRAGLASDEAAEFFERHPGGVMLKTLGLAGARNVSEVAHINAARNLVAEHDDDLAVLLQAKLDTRRFTEMTVDVTVKPDSLEISNVRQILFADGVWVGNLFGPNVELRESHRETLLAVASYARSHGFVSEEGSNCGIDYFVDGDDVVVTEINCRWTGGLFPAEFLRQLGFAGPAVAFIDWVPVGKLDQALDFFERHVHGQPGSAFGVVPMGFAPFAMPIEGADCAYVWQVVTGDFDAFANARAAELPDDALPTATRIQLTV